ncbi:MAG TPA: response regulator transcription factor [Nocardioidaceae bacterium]|nr:response regulator transcription factor [Nocardioidaceae bacterium]
MADVRVLIVDDQEPFRRAMAAVVDETDGFVVVGSATSGEESLTAADELRPDLVLMDVNLPGIDGVEATRQLRSRPEAPIVLLLSTYDEDDFEAHGCGAAAYIAKAALGPDRLSAAWSESAGTSVTITAPPEAEASGEPRPEF